MVNSVLFLVDKVLEGGYIARALNESIFTEGETMQDLQRNIQEAVLCHFEDRQAIPNIELQRRTYN